MADKNSEIEIYIPQSLKGIVNMIAQHKSNTPCHILALPNSKVELLFLAGSLDLNQTIHFHMKNKGILKFFAGLAIGIGIGFATNSIGIGIGIGIAFGAAFSQGKIV